MKKRHTTDQDGYDRINKDMKKRQSDSPEDDFYMKFVYQAF